MPGLNPILTLPHRVGAFWGSVGNAGIITGVVDLVKDPSNSGSLTRSTTFIRSLVVPAILKVFTAAICALTTTLASAQSDRVYPVSGSMISGKVTDIKPDGVTVESGSKKTSVAVDSIAKIVFDGEPASLSKGREFVISGQYDQALDELKRIGAGDLKRDVVKTDAMFFLAQSESKMALTGRGSTTDAATKMLGFVRANPTSFHFYEAAKTLGDLAVSMGKYDQATTYYGALAKAPSLDLKIESKYLTGQSKLGQGSDAEAQADFDAVIGIKAESTAALRIQTLAKAGRAVALARQGKGDEGMKLVDSLIETLNPADSEMSARIYNAQGATLESAGDTLGATIAYLHTHLMCSGQADAHAEALSRLVGLWTKLGKPDRAAEARSELQQRYPGWGK